MQNNPERPIEIRTEGMRAMNLSMQQNYVPLLRSIVLKNTGNDDLTELKLGITFDPAFATARVMSVDGIEAGSSVEITPVDLIFSPEYLFSLTEKVAGNYHIEVYKEILQPPEEENEEASVIREVLGEVNEPVELLPVDQWCGLSVMPELVSAFITPNDPCIPQILHSASDILLSWGKDPSFTAYQTQNANNVKNQMAAIYTAIQALQADYIVSPASFEMMGQRVRLPGNVVEQKQGNCLDLTILYASCLEAAGLNPLLVFIKGHVFAGAWLEKECFADCVVDDISALEKRTADGAEEILLAEMTDVVRGKLVSFDQAVTHGRQHLAVIGDFDMAVDISRCRNSGIRPVPTRMEDLDKSNVFERRTEGTVSAAEAPKELDLSLKGQVIDGGVHFGKKEMWERKLLDMSLRNGLLNFRVTKTAVQLLVTDPAVLEDEIADGKDYLLQPLPAELKQNIRDEKMYAVDHDKALIESVVSEEFRHKRIRTTLSENDLAASLKNLQRAAKQSLEENGANTLFLAAGFLRWYETELSEKPRYAPLVMIPVELVRNMRNSGYTLRSRNEETQINVTLIEYLRQDHGITINGLDPLPEDEHGINMPLILQTIRQAVMDKKKWNVENFCFLGLFSFGQFVMWNDLRNRTEDMKQNKVVNSLLEGHMTWEEEDDGISAGNIDERFAPDDLAVPLSADSSQMVAIAEAAAGKSFVLHGPPGTGKSQTITNIIANALYQGKSVLFVAEKMAALSVVQRRLANIGLDPFCMELHSNKANKSSVLGQLEKTLEVGRIKEPEEYAGNAERLNGLRRELDHVINAIHELRHFGGSLYDAMTVYEQYKDLKGIIDLSESKGYRFDIESVSGDKCAQWQDLIREYAAVSVTAGDIKAHPLKEVHSTEYSIGMRESLSGIWKEAADKCRALSAEIAAVNSVMGLSLPGSKKGMELLSELAMLSMDRSVLLDRIVISSEYDDISARIRQLIVSGRDYQNRVSQAANIFNIPMLLNYNAADALARLTQAENSWFLAKMTGVNRITKELQAYANVPSAINKQNIRQFLEELSSQQNIRNELRNIPAQLKEMMGSLYMDEQTDFNALERALNKADSARAVCRKVRADIWRTYAEKDGYISDTAALKQHLEKLSSLSSEIENIKKQYRISFADIEDTSEYPALAAEYFERFAANTALMREWTGYQKIRQQMEGCGLECVIKAVEDGRISASEAAAAFMCELNSGFITQIISRDPELSDFRAARFEGRIELFEETLKKYRDLTVQELVAKLSVNIPAGNADAAASSELGILKKAIKSNGRMMTIRKLFEKIPTLLRKICPCMLMSPISVAQYIDPAFPKYDLVIFDEASQLPTSEAIGAIARGENVVIVGDPKQLPPTSFFKSNKMDEEHIEQEDLESLLDDCLAISLPQKYLKWHYRSRHESLIAYSNMKYYDNKLYTFPSPNDQVSQVKLVQLEGVYDHGKTRQNKVEAEAVVKEIMRRLTDKKLRQDSIGVVTFSVVQQHLIEDMLSEEFAKNPEAGEYDRAAKEPVFIKNLENVQGDERDVILFSVCYGPDKNGKVSMNFGPLNRDGGWRRLNVAVSRARKEMIVYAVLRPEQIDTSRTGAEGVIGLKGFLEFAKYGSGMIAAKNGSKVQEDAVIKNISSAIAGLGYRVKQNVGCSGYRLDLGIVDPENGERYLLGILLDGKNMSGEQTAADRFSVQTSVLEGLGWKIMRIWTMEWFDDRQKVIEQIRKRIEEVIEEDKKAAEEALKAEEEAAEELPAEAQYEETEDEKETDTETVAETDADTIKLGDYQFERMAGSVSSRQNVYEAEPVQKSGDAEGYADRGNVYYVRSTIVRYFITEAPVSKRTLMKKTFAEWGVSRTTPRMEEAFNRAIEGISCKTTRDRDMIFYWRMDQDPDTYDTYRVPASPGTERQAEDICSQEIRSAMKEILEMQVCLSREDLIKAAAKCFGYTRMGTTIDNVFSYALDAGIESGVFKDTDGKLSLQ